MTQTKKKQNIHHVAATKVENWKLYRKSKAQQLNGGALANICKALHSISVKRGIDVQRKERKKEVDREEEGKRICLEELVIEFSNVGGIKITYAMLFLHIKMKLTIAMRKTKH